jgi:hypothetical protein
VRPSLLLGDRKNLDWEKKRVLFHEDIFLYLVVVLKIQTIESETSKALLELHKKQKGFAYEDQQIS